MLKPKRNVFLNVVWGMIFLIAFPFCFQNKISAGIKISDVKNHLKKRIEIEKTKQSFRCRGELICGISQIPLFYQQRNFTPAWCGDEGVLPQAESLVKAIKNADLEGLEPNDYHLAKITSLLHAVEKKQVPEETIDPEMWVDLDLLLTDAFMLYASHLTAGRVNPETLHTDWVVVNPSSDLVSILQSALSSNQIQQSLRDLRPLHSGYVKLQQFLTQYRNIAKAADKAPQLSGRYLRINDKGAPVQHLRKQLMALDDLDVSQNEPKDVFDPAVESAVKQFQKRHGLKSDGIVGPRTLKKLSIPLQQRVRQIELNMERWRWIPHDLGNRYILVNIADFKLWVTENYRRMLEMRVVVGRSYRRTPVFSAKMTYMVINPFWNIPTRIAIKDILPKIRKNTDYLSHQGIKVFENWRKGAPELDPGTIDWDKIRGSNLTYKFRQDPGPRNALGRIKFMFPNRFAVYLHDTPKHSLFKETVRSFSSGCIRVEKPIDLAVYLLQGDPLRTRQKLMEAIETGKRKVIQPSNPILVHLQYWTAWVDENGRINFRDDIYDRDRPLDRALKERFPDT